MKKIIVASLLVAVLAACGGGGGNSTAAFCEKARVADSISMDFGRLADDASPEQVQKAIDSYVEAADAAFKRAPAEIEETLGAVTSGLKDLRDIARDNGYDLTKTFIDEDFVKLAGDGSLDQASSELDAYLERECGLTPATEDTTGPDDTAATGSDPRVPDSSAGGADEGLAEQLADGFAAASGIELTPEQRSCVGNGLLDDIGLENLAGLADAKDVDAGTLAKVLAVLDRCGVATPTS